MCWRNFTIGWVWYITGDGTLEVLLYLLMYYEGQYVSIRGGCTPLNPCIIKGRLPLAISQNKTTLDRGDALVDIKVLLHLLLGDVLPTYTVGYT